MRPKREMIRVVRTPAGDVLLDTTGKLAGRGAYMCPDVDCFAQARRRNRLGKSLDIEVTDCTWDQLERACLEWQAGGQAKR